MVGENKNLTKKNRNVFKNSRILSFLLFIADWIYKKIGVSIAAFIFTGYENCEKIYEKSFFYKIFQGYEPSAVKNSVKKIKRFIVVRCEKSVVINFIKNFADNILAANLFTIGMFFMSFGFYSSVMYLLKIFILNKPETKLIDLIGGVVLIVFSVLLCLNKKTSLYDALYGSIICNALFFKFLRFPEKREKSFEDLIEKNTNTSMKDINIVCFLIGMVLGILTYVIMSPIGAVLIVCAVIAGIVGLYTVLCYPEAGFFALLFAAPFLPAGNLVLTGAAPCILISICYFLKLIRGKRTFKFEIFDLFVLMFCIVLLFGGLVSVSKTGSIKPALVYLCFTLIYFTGVNIIRSKEMIQRAVIILVFSGFLIALYGIYQNYFGVSDTTWQDTDMFSNITSRVISTLGNPNVLGEYLIMIIPIAVSAVFIANQIKGRIAYIIYTLCGAVCLIFTWSRGSWLGFIGACLILFVIINRKAIVAYIAMIFLVPFVPIVMPTLAQRFTSIGNIGDSSTSYRLSIWQAVIKMIRHYFFEGIGVGTPAFQLVYPEYSLAGIEDAPHSHSLYLQTLTESGIVGFIVLLLVIFFFIQYCFTGIKKSEDKYISLSIAGGLCGIIGFLINGFTDYAWYNYRVYLIFWLIVAVTVAVCRFSLKNNSGANSMYKT
ncbi:MAG: O-antigen ligase family protein [Oscillospiraceae bacterium]|nr:O-antigen ligase family protein [Oscillospiraceae bacterium]